MGKIERVCQALLIASSMIALSAGAALAQDANDLEALNQQILDDPTDVAICALG
jgi:hypothetical protein